MLVYLRLTSPMRLFIGRLFDEALNVGFTYEIANMIKEEVLGLIG
jgi:hypothetical protein